MDHINFIKQAGGVASTQQVARYLGIPSSLVRDWAAENDVRRIGSAFAFDASAVARLAADVEDDADDDFEADDADDADDTDDTDDTDDQPDDDDDLEDEEESEDDEDY